MSGRGNWRDFLSANDYLTAGGTVKKVYWNNGVLLGECVKDVDGFWKFWFRQDRWGAWEGYDLACIAAMLEDLNAEWSAEIESYFENERENDE